MRDKRIAREAGRFVLGVWLAMAAGVLATPVFSIDTLTEWNSALSTPTVSPVSPGAWDDYMAQNPSFYAPTEPYTYSPVTPVLYVYEGAGHPDINEPGLVMAWGETTPSGTNYAGAWQYDYPLDPNLLGTTLFVSVLPPQQGGVGQINSVGVGLLDGAGFIRSWTWNCAAVVGPGTIAWNQLWNLSMGPIGLVPPDPAGATPAGGGPVIAPAAWFSHALFNPANVVSILAYESGQVVGGWVPPPGWLGGPLPLVWNFWGGVEVIPEPGAAGLALLAAGLALRRRR
jgi:hypothetical protein